MYSRNIWKMGFFCLGFLICVMLPSSGHATMTYNVNVDTSALVTNSSQGPFILDYILIDGNSYGDSNNTVTMDNFNFGASPVTMTDDQFFNEADVTFSPLNSSLSFDITMTTNIDSTAPDSLQFAILNSSWSPIPTTDPSLADNLLTVDFDSPTGTVTTYGADLTQTTIDIGAPTVNPVSPVPEPATWNLVCLALVVLAVFGAIRQRVKLA